MSPIGEMVFETAKSMAQASQMAYQQGFADAQLQSAKKIARLEAAMEEALEMIEGYVDVVDGDYGVPAANSAMRATQTLEYALGRRPGP